MIRAAIFAIAPLLFSAQADPVSAQARAEVRAQPAVAQTGGLAGQWALRIDDANIFVFVLTRGEGGQWRGVWRRPASYDGNGAVFLAMQGAVELPSLLGREVLSEVEMRFANPQSVETTAVTYRFRLIARGVAQLTVMGETYPPFPLVAVPANAQIGPFADGRIYDRDNAAIAPLPGAAPPVAAPVGVPAPAPAQTATEAAQPRLEADFLDDF